MHAGAWTLGVVLLVVAGLVGPATAATTGETHQTAQTITVTKEFRLTPDRPGEVEVAVTFEIPDAVSELRPRLPPSATAVRADGFTRTDGEYEWDGRTERPTLTYTKRVNRTREQVGPEGDEGRFVFADTGDWALIQVNATAFGYSFRSGTTVRTVQRNVTAGEGVVGRSMAYLGPHRVYTREAANQRFRLVVPAAASLAESRADIFAAVTGAAQTLRVGDRDRQVLLIAAPTSVPWGVEGLERGERDLYVTADERVDVPNNVWVHEYVHTRQDFNLTDGAQWLAEGTAQYYAALTTLRQGRIDFRTFATHIERGRDRRFADTVLADPPWVAGADYYKGALVAGELDRRLRLGTDGGATFQSVVRRLNRASGRVTRSDLLSFVGTAGGADLRDLARRYTETTDRPAVWSAAEHDAAFGSTPATMVYELPEDPAAFVVRGPVRTTTLAETDAVVPGETVAVDATATNVGGTDGRFNLTLSADDRVVDFDTGRLAPDESTTVPVAVTLRDPGTRTLSVGGDRRTVGVLPAATLSVTALTVDRERVSPGASVTVTATVENLADRPGESTLRVFRNDDLVTNRTLRLAPGDRTTLTATVPIPRRGRYRLTVGDRSTVVTGGATDTAGGAGPGVGAPGVLAALVLVRLIARLRG